MNKQIYGKTFLLILVLLSVLELNSSLKVQMDLIQLYKNSVQRNLVQWEKYLKEKLLPAADAYLKVLMKPKRAIILQNDYPLNPVVLSKICKAHSQYFDPNQSLHSKWNADTDFLVVLQFWDNSKLTPQLSKGYMWATSCLRASPSEGSRPLGGVIGINVEQLTLPSIPRLENNEKDAIIHHETNLYILLHEYMHLFAFLDDHFSNFVDENGNKLNYFPAPQQFDNTFWIKIWPFPKHTQFLRDHYNCPIFSEGAFFDAINQAQFINKIYGPELMNSGGMLKKRIQISPSLFSRIVVGGK